jgi:hypothetical protein
MAIGSRTYRDATLPMLAAEPWFTAKEPPCDLSDIAERMNKPGVFSVVGNSLGLIIDKPAAGRTCRAGPRGRAARG